MITLWSASVTEMLNRCRPSPCAKSSSPRMTQDSRNWIESTLTLTSMTPSSARHHHLLSDPTRTLHRSVLYSHRNVGKSSAPCDSFAGFCRWRVLIRGLGHGSSAIFGRWLEVVLHDRLNSSQSYGSIQSVQDCVSVNVRQCQECSAVKSIVVSSWAIAPERLQPRKIQTDTSR